MLVKQVNPKNIQKKLFSREVKKNSRMTSFLATYIGIEVEKINY